MVGISVWRLIIICGLISSAFFYYRAKRRVAAQRALEGRAETASIAGKWGRRLAVGLLVAAGVYLVGSTLLASTFVSDGLYDRVYQKRLDAWVAAGGPIAELQERVVGTCGKIVETQGGPFFIVRTILGDREDFDFRVDVCTKMTVNRVHPQPEFEKPEMAALLCDGENELFRKMCRRSGLR